jgi:hypothetical protein
VCEQWRAGLAQALTSATLVPGRCRGAQPALARAFPLLRRATVAVADGRTGSHRDHLELFSALARQRHLGELRVAWRACDMQLADAASWELCRVDSDALWGGLQQALPLVRPRWRRTGLPGPPHAAGLVQLWPLATTSACCQRLLTKQPIPPSAAQVAGRVTTLHLSLLMLPRGAQLAALRQLPLLRTLSLSGGGSKAALEEAHLVALAALTALSSLTIAGAYVRRPRCRARAAALLAPAGSPSPRAVWPGSARALRPGQEADARQARQTDPKPAAP